nr:hypothetical protein [Tanacetum cinerariifolium]
NSTLSALQDDLILSVIEQLKTQVVNCTKVNQDNKKVNELLTAKLERYRNQERILTTPMNDDNKSTSYAHSVEIESLKHTLSEHLKEKKSLEQKITLFKNDFQKEESRNIDRELALEKEVKELNNIVFKRHQSAQIVHMLIKPQVFYNHATRQALGFQNPRYLKKAQQLKPNLYDGSVIGKSDVVVVPDSEDTLMHAEESRSKMIEKQNDLPMIKKKVIIKPIDYAKLNQLSTDFNTRFVPQIESYAEQAFWFQYSVQTDEPNLSGTTIVKVLKELPKVSMVNSCLKKLKFHLASFDMVVKERTTATAITEGMWGFEHTKACFRDDIIPFVKHLKELFTSFDQCLIDEVTEAQAKDTVILKLKEKLNALNGDVKNRHVKRNVEESETLNIELGHQVTKLATENNHLKQTYKKLYDSIKSSRVRLKEQCDDLIKKVNLKSVEVSDLNAHLQEKVLVDTTPVVPKLRKNRTAHIDYIRHTQAEAATLRKIVESERLLSPLNTSLDYACKVFKTVGHIWKPTGRTFTLVGHACPLTRIATPNIVPPREPILIVNKTDKPVVTLGLVRGLLKLKFEKDHLCSACVMGKSMRKTHKPKSEDTNQEKLYLLYMDLCGPMRVESVNGKKYILVIVDDYSQFTWVRLKVLVCHIRTNNGTEFVKHTLRDYYEEVGISHETSVARSPQQNGVVERRNRTLIEAARTMLIYAQSPLFLWAEAVATACFTQNHSIIHLRHGKTPYELLHSKLPDLSFFHVFGALCYPTNDSENLAMASEQRSSGPVLNEMTPGTISSGLLPSTSPSTYYVPPSRNDWDLLFQPMFDELLNPPPSVVNQVPEAIAPIVEVIPPVNVDLTGSPSLTIVEQDAPSTSNSTTPTEIQPSIIPQDVGDDNLDMEVAHMGSDPLFGIPILEVNSEQSTTPVSPQLIVQTDHPLPHHNSKWTKDHPLNNIIGQLDIPVSTLLQLYEQALFCYYDAFLTSIEPKTYKEALTQS